MFSEVSAWVEQNISEELFPGAVICLGSMCHLRCMRAFGTLDGERPVTLDTKYDMASVSKVAATTMVALRMLQDGALHLRDTVGSFFPAAEDKRGITVEQLMTHTSGIPTFRIDEALNRRGYTLEEAIAATLDTPLHAKPGEETEYSCNGYIVLGGILERVGAMPLDRLARRLVFEPLQMMDTGYAPIDGVCAPTGWDPDSGAHVCGIHYDRNARYMRGVAGNAGVFSTIKDMARMAEMLAGGGRFRGETFLSPEMFGEAVRCRTPSCAQHWGLGLMLSDGKNAMGTAFPPHAFGHTGSTGTSICVDAERGYYVVALTNRLFYGRDDQRILAFRRRLHDLGYAALQRECE